MTRKGPRRDSGGEGVLVAARRLRSHRKIPPQESEASGVVLCTPRLRGRDFSKRGEAQGGRRGLGGGRAALPSTPDMSSHLFFFLVSKIMSGTKEKNLSQFSGDVL